jgi:hypothetical protein
MSKDVCDQRVAWRTASHVQPFSLGRAWPMKSANERFTDPVQSKSIPCKNWAATSAPESQTASAPPADQKQIQRGPGADLEQRYAKSSLIDPSYLSGRTMLFKLWGASIESDNMIEIFSPLCKGRKHGIQLMSMGLQIRRRPFLRFLRYSYHDQSSKGSCESSHSGLSHGRDNEETHSNISEAASAWGCNWDSFLRE